MKLNFPRVSRAAVACALATAALSPSIAFAQSEQDSADQETDEGVVVVNGYLLQNRTAIDAKRNDDRIADFLTSDELGRQPDLNVADSLRRLPGVVTVFDEDEGVPVGLRGLPAEYSYVSIDGGLIASTDRSDRDINLEVIPPTAVSKMEVIKSVTADLDGQSVGGVVNMVTRSAFDADGLFFVANGQLGIHSSIGDLPESHSNPSYRIDGAISNTFGDNDQVGVLLAGNYFVKNRDQGRPILGSTTNDIGRIVNSVLPLDYSNSIERWNILGKLEFQPSSDFYAGLSASHFDYQYSEVRYRFALTESDLVNQTADSGTFEQASADARFDRFPLNRSVDTLNGKIDWSTSDRGRFQAMANYSHGKLTHPYPNAIFRSDVLPGLGYTYDYADQDFDAPMVAGITINDPSLLSDYDLYEFLSYTDGYFEENEKVFEAKVDYAWNTEGRDAGLGFKVGAKYRNLQKDRWDDTTRYTLSDPNMVLTVGDFVDSSNLPYTADYLGFGYPVIDPGRFDAFFAANQGLFTASDASNLGAYYDVTEEVTAAYGMATFSAGRHKLIAGLRFEHTNEQTSAVLNGGPDTIEREFDYDNWLPSAVYTFEAADNLRFRLGYAKALGRPNYPVMAGAETIDEANLTITRANTDIRPRLSDSFDIGMDWFIAPGQYFSVAAFHKIIANQISTVTTEEQIDGETWTVRQPVNLDEVKVSGLEISYTDDKFEFLPAPFDGLGITANLTILDGQDGPAAGGNLISQPDYLFNIAALYSNGPVSAKLTYNYVDDRPTSATRNEYRYDQLDAQVRLQVTEQVQVQVEGRNILNNPRKNYDVELNRLREINDFGNSWWFGVSFRY